MNGRIVWRVMWKEYRALRGLWIAVAIASWCTQLAALVWGRQFSLFELAATASLITPVFYVLGVAAVMLADERGPDADPLLRGMSTPVGPLATGKIAFLALSAVAMIPAAGALATVGLLWPGSAEPAFWHTLELIWAPAIVEGVAWGLFLSLLRRGAAHAVVFGFFAAAVALAVAMRYFAETIESDAVDYAWSLWLRLAMVAGIVLVDWTLARLWLRIRVANEFNAPEGWWGGLRFLAHRQHVDRRALGRVMWKEYRALRGMWIAVAAASWTAQLAVLALSRDASWFDVAFGAALVTPVFYALGAAAASFAGEREEGADRFLVSLPLPIAPLVTGKILFLLLSTLAIVPVVSLTASISPWWPQAEYFEVDLYFIWGPAVLEVIVWALLFSLLGRTVMQAACLGAVAAAVAVSVALWLTNDVVDQVDAEQYANALFARLGIVGLVLLADLALVRQWLLRSLEGERSGIRTWMEGLRAARQRAVSWALRPLRWQGRLAWLAVRQSAGAMALAVAAPIVLGLFVPIRHGAWFTEWTAAGKTQIVPVWEGNLVFLALLVGSMVFAADQQQRGYRLLAEQGASARAFWVSRQAIGLAVLVLGVVAWHLAWRAWHGGDLAPARRVGSADAGWADWHGITAREWALVAMAYGVGQAMSLFFRSNIVGTLVALFAVVPFFVWYRFSTYLALPAAYTLWPLALGLLAATAVFVPRWLLDRRGPTTWLRVGGTFGFFACGVLAIVPELRLSGIPDVAVDFDPAEFRATLGGDARETALLYVDAMVAMKPLDPAIDDGSLDQHERSLLAESLRTALRERLLTRQVTDADRQWLAANQRTIDLALEANAEPTCAFVAVPGAGELPYRTREDLVNLLLLRGVAAENQIEATQEAIGDVLRLIRHIRPFPLSAAALERSALEFITTWSVWPGQTPESLLAMRESLVAYEQSLPNPNEIIKLHYLEAADRLAELHSYMMPVWDSWLRRAPWERVRAERLLRERTNENLTLVDMTLANLQGGKSLEWLRNYQQLGLYDLRYQTTSAFRHSRFMQGMGFNLSIDAARRAASRRATQIILELGAYRLRTGALPETLAELERADAAPLPVDPYTGLNFRYFPHGFPVTLRPSMGLGAIETVSWSEGQPLLWSPGFEVQVTETQEDGSPGPGYSVADERGNFVKVQNGLGAWVVGLSFRIPQ